MEINKTKWMVFFAVIRGRGNRTVWGLPHPLLFMFALLTELEDSNPRIAFHSPTLVSNR